MCICSPGRQCLGRSRTAALWRGGGAALQPGGCPGSRWLIWSNVLLTSHSQIPPRAPVPGTSSPALLFPRCLFPATVHSFPLPPAPTLPSHFLRVTQRPHHTLFQLCGHTHSQSHTPRAPASLLPNKEPFLTQASSPRPSPSFCSCFHKLAGHAVQFPWVSGSVRRGVGVTCVGTDSAARCAGLQLPGTCERGWAVRAAFSSNPRLSLGEAQGVLMERRWQGLRTEAWPADPVATLLMGRERGWVETSGTHLLFGQQGYTPC